MSTSSMVMPLVPSIPMSRRVRAYFAPVNRVSETPTLFDASQAATFAMSSVPAPWLDLGWISGFSRKSDTKIATMQSGSPSVAQYQVRQTAGSTVSFLFEQWTKLTMALACGSEHMNVLQPAPGGTPSGAGAIASPAHTLQFGGAVANSATSLVLSSADAANYSAGSLVVVDSDYTGQTGFVGSGVAAAYVQSSASVAGDVNYTRRVSFNVSRVQQATTQGLLLAQPLPAGIPVAGMKVQPVLSFVDREGGSFLQEWSALFVMTGEQDDAIFFHYPRLQSMAGAAETCCPLAKALEQIMLSAAFRALPVVDPVDGQNVFCFRTYVPAPSALV